MRPSLSCLSSMPATVVKAPRRRTAPDGTSSPTESFGDVNVAPVSGIAMVLAEHGIDVAPMLRAAGLREDLFTDPSRPASIIGLAKLLESAAHATGKPHFGLLAGQRFELPMLGITGYLMRNEATVGAALRTLVFNLRLHDRGAVAGITELGARLVGASYGVCTPGTPATGLVDDIALMIGARMMRALAGPAWRATEVQLAHGTPAEPRLYRDLFGAPVRFDAPLSMLVFERRWMDAPVLGADPTLLALLRQLLAEAQGRAASRLTDQVRRVLRSSVLNGSADAESIAAVFSTSARSLRRRLADEGSHLHDLVAEARLIVARQLLEETRLPVSEVAAALHYSDLTAFSRAFRQWTGKPPTAWRRPAA
jgi:AraC-like DNA-binding protein